MKQHILILSLFVLAFCSFTKPTNHKPRKGKDYALLFAVEQYADKRLQPLKYPMTNARDIQRELTETYGFECQLVSNPSVQDIIVWLEKYKANFDNGVFDKDGQLFIFFQWAW